jgi:general secretion pathway protein G
VKKLIFEKKVSRALTLIELLAVLTILALVVGIAGPAIYRQVTQGRMRTTEAQIAAIEKSLNSFYLDCGFFPRQIEDLIAAPTEGRLCPNFDPDGYFERGSLPVDPWGNSYLYQSPGEVRATSYDLYSAGPDGEPGTEDDITNWE